MARQERNQTPNDSALRVPVAESSLTMEFQWNDGGREAAGFKGKAGDCVCRSIAIASGMPYREVYDALAKCEGTVKRKGHARAASARNGITIQHPRFKQQMLDWGFRWVPTMGIGTGCQAHLHDGELPHGRLVVRLSKHCTAAIDGVIHDTFDPQREERRCVYGYWVWESAR